jgi:4-hydroxythreonine-4-phosphate dehydrogenase
MSQPTTVSQQSSAARPRIAVTMGDPAGVGPELCLRLLANDELAQVATPIVFGDAKLLDRVSSQLRLTPPELVVSFAEWTRDWARIDRPVVVDLRQLDCAAITPGQVSAAAGAASYRYLERAIHAALAGEVAAICTAPIHKEALHAAGISHPGHTEILAELTGASRVVMMLTSDAITCSLVTAHVGLHEVPGLLTVERITETIELTHATMRSLRRREPRLVVCGLNPHAGEHGLFGTGEEERLIQPAIDAARRNGMTIEGPLPPDTAFLPSRRERTDAYICMYHDQGLIPLKMLAFDEGINVTLGLPIVRTSVDHGTAYDIAWQGKASPTSLYAAFRLAAQFAELR